MTSFSIDDLAQPILSNKQQQIVEMFESIEVDLSINSILKEASDATSLSNFGDELLEQLPALHSVFPDATII